MIEPDAAKKTILIIEDDQRLSAILVRVLGEKGYVVHAETEGKKGLVYALAHHPDVIILDIMLPDTEGLGLLHSLRADSWGKDAHVVFLSNLSPDQQSMQTIVDDTPAYYLVKADTSIERIIEVVESVLTGTVAFNESEGNTIVIPE
jgi:DNA-binding response OmpR family regulator